MDAVIRPARPLDEAALAALCGELGYPIAAADLARNLGHLLGDPAHALFVAETEGSVAGWIHVREGWTLESGSRAELTGLVVDSGRRGRGIGALLVAAAEAWARDRGLERIRVRSRVQRQDAHRFYRRLGYAESKVQAILDRDL